MQAILTVVIGVVLALLVATMIAALYLAMVTRRIAGKAERARNTLRRP